MLRAAIAGAATLLLVLVAALTTTTGSVPIRHQVASASPQVDTAVPKVPEPLPSATVTVAPPKLAPSPARVAAVAPQPTSAPVVRSVTGNPGVAPVRSLVSTAYCESGLMASGTRTYWGAVAMAEPFGSRWLVLSGPLAGGVFTAADRYGHGTQFDVAMPGECGRARVYGLRIIQVQRVG